MIRNVFIPHVHEDDDRIQALKDLLGRRGVELRNASIDSSKPNQATDPDYIKNDILAPGINWAGAVIVLVGPNTATSEWVEWETEYANKKDKMIIGVWDHGAKDADLPDALEKYADAMTGWDAASIIRALEGKEVWATPSGKKRPPRPIDRHNC